MSITDWPLLERPRERLLQLGAAALSDAELLAIFLRTGVKGKSAVDLARDLLKKAGGLRQLLESPQQDFCNHKGLGNAKYVLLQAMLEMARRHTEQHLKHNDIITNSRYVKQYFICQLRHRKREVFACLFLDNRHRIICFEELFYGTINHASVHPREVVKRALQLNAAAVILSHNHPSGSTTPSSADQQMTEQLVAVLTLVDIRVLDHIIVGEGEVSSFAELGLLSIV